MTNYQDPNLSLDDLFKGASEFPWDVEKNLALPLLALEDPAKYAELQDAIVDGWRVTGVKQLSWASERLYQCDCVEMVLHHFEVARPNDLRPREAVEVARRFIQGLATEAERKRAERNAELSRVPLEGPGREGVYHVANAAFWAVNGAKKPLSEQCPAAYESARADKLAKVGSVLFRTGLWRQAQRVRHYYYLESQEVHCTTIKTQT